MSTEQRVLREVRSMARIHFMAIATGVMLLSGYASASDDGPTFAPVGCMQTQFGTPVTGANRLNCTANDIKLSKAIAVSPATCTRGTHFDLTATFEVNVTANARYDAGFFFRTDGGANARGDGLLAEGVCSLSALEPRTPANPPTLDLDGDTCGDMNASPADVPHQVTFTIPDVYCVAAPGTEELKLPNCTSWHSNQGTACSIDKEGDFKPDTKSKCVCDDTFTVPVKVEAATLTVHKTANPPTLPEPGGTVTFTVRIVNSAEVESVVIKSIIDDVFKDVGAICLDSNGADLIDETLLPGEANALTCTFDGALEGNDRDQHKNTVKVTAHQASTNTDIFGSDFATVDFTGVYTAPTVSKEVQSTANCSVDATYQVVVSNNSAIDTLSINSLTDDKFGDLTSAHPADDTFEQVVSTTCDSLANPFPTAIDQLGNYSCSFVGRITSTSCDFSHENTVTADVTDDDGENTKPTDDALVSVDTTP